MEFTFFIGEPSVFQWRLIIAAVFWGIGVALLFAVRLIGNYTDLPKESTAPFPWARFLGWALVAAWLAASQQEAFERLKAAERAAKVRAVELDRFPYSLERTIRK